MRLAQRGFRVAELAPRDREVGRAPKRARYPPAVARAPEDVTRFCEASLRGFVFACRHLDQAEPRERQAAAAAVAQPRTQVERPPEQPPRRFQIAFDERDVRAPDEGG